MVGRKEKRKKERITKVQRSWMLHIFSFGILVGLRPFKFLQEFLSFFSPRLQFFLCSLQSWLLNFRFLSFLFFSFRVQGMLPFSSSSWLQCMHYIAFSSPLMFLLNYCGFTFFFPWIVLNYFWGLTDTIFR